MIKFVLCDIVCMFGVCGGCLCGWQFSCRALLCRVYLNNKIKCVSLIVSSSIDTKDAIDCSWVVASTARQTGEAEKAAKYVGGSAYTEVTNLLQIMRYNNCHY